MSNARQSLESTFTRAWQRRGLIAIVLWPLSLLFRCIVGLRRWLYASGLLDSTRLPIPVIVVGNIFVGGTGKTPFVIWLAETLRAAGFHPGILSRGYGGTNRQPQRVMPDALPQDVGDEPLLIARRTHCPVMIGRDRATTGKALLAAEPSIDILIMDDGLQHYALQRDIEIVLSDQRGDGNGWMLPAGPLREPASRPRDFTVVNGGNMHLAGGFAEKLDAPDQRIPLTELQNIVKNSINRPPKVLAAAGIGNPARFFSQLLAADLTFEALPLPDHFDYKTSPFTGRDADIILITEKDAVKCRVFESPENIRRLWVVPVTAQLETALAERIVERCHGSRSA